MIAPRVALAREMIAADAPPDVLDTVRQTEAVGRSLDRLGWAWTLVLLGPDGQTFLDDLGAFKPDLVFNLVESWHGRTALASAVPVLCRAAGLPCTGAEESGMMLCADKSAARRVMAAAGLPAPAGVDLASLAWGEFPGPGAYIVKSRFEDASLGLDVDAVVTAQCPADLVRAMTRRAPAMGGACVAERYVAGREFNLALLAGPGGAVQALPLAEMVFAPVDSGQRILHYVAKWDEDSAAFAASTRSFDLGRDADRGLVADMIRVGLRCWSLFGLAGYARIDFRVSDGGEVFVIDVNPNPCIAPDSGFMAAARHAGLSPEQVVGRIAQDALERAGRRAGHDHG